MIGVVLASSSPRRRELLGLIGIEPEVVVPDVDEERREGEALADFVERVTISKGLNVYQPKYFHSLVVSADTIVVINRRVIGKPADRQDARHMLEILSGQMHEVWTGVALLYRGQTHFDISKTKVHFKKISSPEIENYLARAEYLDKAGAYAIQGLAALFVERIEGCFFNVMGFPLNLFYRMAKKLDISFFKNGSPR